MGSWMVIAGKESDEFEKAYSIFVRIWYLVSYIGKGWEYVKDDTSFYLKK